MPRLRTLCLVLLLAAAPLCLARDLAVVANKSNATAGVSADQVEKLLKASTPTWPDGKKVKIFLTDPASADTKMLIQRVYRMTPEEFKTFLETHRAEVQIVGSDELAVTMVVNNPGSIGVVNVYSINSRVKVLKVDEKLPMEPGYLLHGN